MDTNLRGAVTVVTQAPGCASRTVLLSTGRLLCPRYAATFKVGHASGHQGCFGRVSPLALMPTVVTRPEPHNLCIVHPTQDRVLTPRCGFLVPFWSISPCLTGQDNCGENE